MRRGFNTVMVGLAMLSLACVLLPALINLCVYEANARADFSTWANRSARLLEPADYNTNGTSACQVCSWKGIQGIGNVGIGNGNVSAVTDNTTKEETLYPDYDLQGVVTTENSQYPDTNRISAGVENSTGGSTGNVAGNVTGNATGNATAGSAGKDASPDLKIGGVPGIITYGSPYRQILQEYPVEAAAVYGKLTGLRMPDGRNVEIGVKSIGYEY